MTRLLDWAGEKPAATTASISGVAFFFIALFTLPIIFGSTYGGTAICVGGIFWLIITAAALFYAYARVNNKSRASIGAREEENGVNLNPGYTYGSNFVTIANSQKTRAVLTDGLQMVHLIKLREAINSGEIDAISARAIHDAGVLTREPSASPNASDLVTWLTRPSYGLTESLGNSRYKLSRIGHYTLMCLPNPPTPLLEEDIRV